MYSFGEGDIVPMVKRATQEPNGLSLKLGFSRVLFSVSSSDEWDNDAYLPHDSVT